jgi:hypothetical protein
MARATGVRLLFVVVLVLALLVTPTPAAREPAPPKSPPESLARGNAKLKIRQATITAMAVKDLDDGKLVGVTLPIIATVTGKVRGGKVTIRGKVGSEMKTALDEAVRYVRLEAPRLASAQIEISFEDKYTPKDGGSAGAAFTVLMKSLFDGFEIDKHVAVTGDIAVDGNIQKIGGIASKIRGAIADKYTIVTLPKSNAAAVADLFVTPDRFDVLKHVQIFAVETIPDMIGIVRTDRAQKLDQAMTLYQQVQTGLEQGGLSYLHKDQTQALLKQVLELAPNHVSAKYALDISQDKGPRTLTRTGSLVEIFSAAYPFWQAMSGLNTRKHKHLTREMLPSAMLQDIMKQLRDMRARTHPDVEPLRTAMIDWIDAVDRVLSARRGQVTQSDLAIIDRRASALDKQLERLGTDQKLIEKIMREGY